MTQQFREGQEVEVIVAITQGTPRAPVCTSELTRIRRAKIVRPWWTLYEALVEFPGTAQREPAAHERIRAVSP